MKNNKKIQLIILGIILLVWILFLVSFFNTDKDETNLDWLWIDDLWNTELTKDEINVEKAKERMNTLRKKMTLKWLIAKWDLYFENEEYTIALTKYLQVYKDIPEDQEVNLKLWNIYYNLNKFSKANTYYSKIKNYPSLNKTQALKSYLNSSQASSWTIVEINKEIDSFWLDEQENFYYKNSTICVFDYSQCRKNFKDYFEKQNNWIKSWEFTDYKKFEDLKKIEDAFINYENFQIDDLSYKAALITWAFYENWFYYASLGTSELILDDNPNYKPVLKIAAKSSYELWDYILAKKYLIKYNKIESNDPEVSYFLWRVYEKLNEDILSIIHFNKALKIGYPNVTDIRRRLIFIYFEIEENEKMLSVFKELIDSNSKDLNLNDYNLAIYYHIINDDLEIAEKYSEIAKKKFTNSELFYWYYSWIMLQKEDLTEFQIKVIGNNINKAIEINDKNPMIVMVKWMLELKKENYDEAFSYFKKTISLDKNWEYKETAKIWLDKIPKETDDNKK